MTATDFTIACTGRALNARNEPTGDPCGKTYPRRSVTVGAPDPRYDGWGVMPLPDDQYVTRARVAGWAVHINDGRADAMCPACRRPTKEMTALLRDLRQSTLAQPEGIS